MGFIRRIWNIVTHTHALEQSSGKYETLFFESVYRVTYLAACASKAMTKTIPNDNTAQIQILPYLGHGNFSQKCLSGATRVYPPITFSGWSVYDRCLLYRMYSGLIKTATAIFICSELWYLFSETASIAALIDNVNATIIHLIALYRYKNMIENKQIYKELAKSMESQYFDTTTKKRKELVKFWSQRNEMFLKLLLSLGFGALSAWNIYPLVDDVEYNLMVATKLPFNYQVPILYPITYVVVLIVFNYTSLFVMINDLIMQAHLLHLLCQFTVLADCFENILEDCAVNCDQKKLNVNEAFMNKYRHRLNGLVEQHKFLLNNTMKLKRSLSAPMLGQFAASSMLICGISFQATTTIGISIVKFFMSLLYLMYNMFELFIFCKWCDEIKIQSENISRAVYFSGWEHGVMTTPGVRTSLLLVTARAQKPLILTAGGLFILSLASYTTLVKTSYSALTVLRRFQVE